jgi:hypothetical protein
MTPKEGSVKRCLESNALTKKWMSLVSLTELQIIKKPLISTGPRDHGCWKIINNDKKGWLRFPVSLWLVQRSLLSLRLITLHSVFTSFEVITFETDIILVVNVPVLSLQITVVQPKVSTDGKDRTMAFNRAIRFVPRAKHLNE